MGADQGVRDRLNGLPAPDLGPPSATEVADLSTARVAIVTTAGLRPAGDITLWGAGDGSFTVLPGDARDLQLSHFSPNFDRAGFVADINVTYPVDRLGELADEGVIGSVNHRHLSFMGAQLDLFTIIHDTGPAAARLLLDDEVDVVLLTPV
ncbi:MAG: glycine/sarcosine/betaine reductase selenoprotein B family protein [Acidimicrobiales bacterium]